MEINEHITEKINELIKLGELEVFFSEGEFINIGLKWGEGKRLEGLGISRNDQVILLNLLEQEIKQFRLCPHCLSRDLETHEDKTFKIYCKKCKGVLLK